MGKTAIVAAAFERFDTLAFGCRSASLLPAGTSAERALTFARLRRRLPLERSTATRSRSDDSAPPDVPGRRHLSWRCDLHAGAQRRRRGERQDRRREGFRPKVNGFSFENYGSGKADLSANELRLLFGSRVCMFVKKSGACVLTPSGQAWLKQQNREMRGGHCTGMSVLSLLLFRHQFPAFGSRTRSCGCGATCGSSGRSPTRSPGSCCRASSRGR